MVQIISSSLTSHCKTPGLSPGLSTCFNEIVLDWTLGQTKSRPSCQFRCCPSSGSDSLQLLVGWVLRF